MEIYESIVFNDILKKFKSQCGSTLMNHSFNTCGIEQSISIASVFWPRIVEENGHIFISEFYNNNLDELKLKYNNDRKLIETAVNSWSLADFFLEASDESVHNDFLIEEFGRILSFFWNMRFKELFPNKNIIVETGLEIMGERGLTITVYQE
jgi:hypothetical protein